MRVLYNKRMDFWKSFAKKFSIDLIIFLVLIGGIFFVQADIQKRADKISAMKQEIGQKAESFKLLSNLSAQESMAKEYSLQMDAYLIGKDGLFLNFSKDISLLAQQNGINSQLAFKEEIPPTDMEARKTSFALSLSGQANLDNFNNFLVLVENSRYFIRLEGIDFNQSGNNLSASLSGKAFSF